MTIQFDVTENKQDTRPDRTPIPNTKLIRVNFRPLPNSPIHSNVFHMQLYPAGTRLLIDSRGRLVTLSGKLVAPAVFAEALPFDFPAENPADPYRRETFTRNNDAEMVKNIEAYWARKLRAAAEGRPWPLRHNTTLNLQVGANADDALHFDLSGHTYAPSNLNAGAGRGGDGTEIYECVQRFTGLTIGQADTIDSAALTFTALNSRSTNTVNTNIDAEDADDADVIDNDTEYDAVVHTTAFVPWDAISAWTGETDYTSPDFKSVIQEIVDRGSWASGNAANIFWMDDGSSDTDNPLRTGHSYNSDSAKAPKLDIDYTAAATGISFLPRYGRPIRHLIGR